MFTTDQVKALAFDRVHTARDRLMLLQRRGIVAQLRNAGTEPGWSGRWTLDHTGAAYIAARTGEATPSVAAVRRRIAGLTGWARLGHLLAVNGFFVNLAAHARTTPGARLDLWWSQRRCSSVGGGLVRPDGHGQWTEAGRTIKFWLEHDQTTDQRHTVGSKLDGYAALNNATALRHMVLFWLTDPGRETWIRQVLAQHPALRRGRVAVATAAGPAAHPAAQVWAPLHPGSGIDRFRLADLPTTVDLATAA